VSITGVCEQALKPGELHGKTAYGNVMVANRTREIRPSGMKTEAIGNMKPYPGETTLTGSGDRNCIKMSAPIIYPNN